MINGKRIGIVILNYNDSDTVFEYYNLIRHFKCLDHIIIVDNQSPDGSFEKLQSLAGNNVEIIQSDANKGYSYGNNFGAFYLINQYNIDIIFISNPDVEYPEDFLYKIVDDMDKYNAQAATGYMELPKSQELKMYRKINSYWEEVLDCTFLLKRLISFQSLPIQYGQGIINVEWLPGSLFAIDAHIYKKLGGLDDRVFLYYEEQVLGKKFLNAGFKMVLDTDVKYKHNVSVSINKSMRLLSQLKQSYRSKYFYFKEYEHIGFIKQVLMKCAIFYGTLRRLIRCKFL